MCKTVIDCDRASDMFGYLERLQVHHNVQSASDKAIIAYDERNREASSEPWDWLSFNHETFLVAQREYQVSAPTPVVSGGGGTKPKGSANAQPYSKQRRTKQGYCNMWKEGKTCTFSTSDPKGCRFSHWCRAEACLSNNATHKPKDCPTNGV